MSDQGRVEDSALSFLRHASQRKSTLADNPPGLKSAKPIPIFLAMHSQAVIRLKRGK
jgi:hypothetical protein